MKVIIVPTSKVYLKYDGYCCNHAVGIVIQARNRYGTYIYIGLAQDVIYLEKSKCSKRQLNNWEWIKQDTENGDNRF